MTQNANEVKKSRSFAEQSVFVSSIPSSMFEIWITINEFFTIEQNFINNVSLLKQSLHFLPAYVFQFPVLDVGIVRQ